MKKNRTLRVLLIISVIAFFVTTVVGFFYYAKYEEYLLLAVLMTLQNSIKSFVFTTSLETEKLLEEVLAGAVNIPKWFVYAYGIAIFLSYLCTIGAAALTVKLLIYKFKPNFIWSHRRKKLMVFGYNQNTKILIDNLFRKQQDEEMKEADKYLVYLVADVEVSKNEEIELAKKGVLLLRTDYLKADMNERKKLREYMDKVILFEDSATRNLAILLEMEKTETEIEEEQKKKKKIKEKVIECHIFCQDEAVRELIEIPHEDIREKESKVRIDVKVFSLAELIVRKMFDKEMLYSLHGDSMNIHMLIAGFGALGQEVLKETMNLGIISGNGNIWIDVVDNTAEEKADLFMKNFAKGMLKEERGEHSLCYVLNDSFDGELQIRFFNMDLRGKNFKETLDIITCKNNTEGKAEMPLTYVAVCVTKADVAIACMNEVKAYASQDERYQDLPIAVRMEMDSCVVEYFKQDENKYKKVFPIAENKSTITLDNIFDEEDEKRAKATNSTYNSMYEKILNKNQETDRDKEFSLEKDIRKDCDKEWAILSYDNKESNRQLSHYNNVTLKEIIKAMYEEEKERLWSLLIGNEEALLQKAENKGAYGYTYHQQELLQKLQDEKYKDIKEFMKIEQRRWCYNHAVSGWTYGNRDDKKKVHDCLTSFDELMEKHPEKVVYNLIPLLMQYEEENK